MHYKLKLILFLVLSNCLFAQTYQLNVIKKNGVKKSYDLLTIKKVTFDNISTPLFTLTYPSNNSVEIPVTPILKWTMISGAAYSLQISLNQDMSNPIADLSDLTDNSYKIISALRGQTKYFWRVKSQSDSKWTDTWSFTTAMPFMFAPASPLSFAVINENSNSLRIKIKTDPAVQSYNVYLSKDGINFNDSLALEPDSMIVNNLQTDSLYYIKLKASNSGGTSAFSEVLAGIPSSQKTKILLVHGFDRKSAGNTFNFIRFHAGAFYNDKHYFCSSTNDAVTDGLISLKDFNTADYILGDESTADETLSKNEQDSLKVFLSNGGNLFISGSEIAWDLDNKGSASDKSFIWDYLKMKFITDAPLNKSATYYQSEPIANSIFAGMQNSYFDNGTKGTIDVKYPDAIKAINGAKGCLKFTDVDTSQGYAGIYFSGLFPNSPVPGKVVCLTVPFESFYPEENRIKMVKQINAFFENTTSADGYQNNSETPKTFVLFQNYPNPFNPTTTIKFHVPFDSKVSLKVFDLLGREVLTLIDEEKSSGTFEYSFNAENLSSGLYFYKLQAGSYSDIKKMCILK